MTQIARAIQPPPRTGTKSNLGSLVSPDARPPELDALEGEKLAADPTLSQNAGDALARAVLVQSQGLTSLVLQIASAHSDPMSDLAAWTSAGTRGASARARLQMELAAHRGSFFNAVMQSISSRNNSYQLTPRVCRGTPSARCQWCEAPRTFWGVRQMQTAEPVAISGDCRSSTTMMAQNFPAATDGLALLAVTIEQVSLDGGRMELATLLCLHEDPPSSIFMPTVKVGPLHPLGGQKVVDMCLGVFEGAGGDQFKPHRELSTGKPASDNSSGAPHSKSRREAESKVGKEERKRKGRKPTRRRMPSRHQR